MDEFTAAGPLSREQRMEMLAYIREHKTAGRPQVAAPVQKALQEGYYYMPEPEPEPEPLPEPPPRHGPGSGGPKWKKWALEMTALDPELVESAKKDDLIAMLEANGMLDKENAESGS